MAPPEKKQKTSEEKEAAAEKEEAKELEQDAKRDGAPKIKDEVKFLTPDTTMNVMPATVGNMLVPMTEGGLVHLVAGARANVGVKTGRYMFEVKIVEEISSEGGKKGMARVGFSTEGSLYLGEDDNSVGFESDGCFIHKKAKKKVAQPFGRDVMVAVVLNLDASSPNANTVSLFKDGVRVSEPQPLPDDLKGKTLFPAVSFRGVSVHANFAAPVAPLPFKCKTMTDASAKEAVVTKHPDPEGGKYTALFPVGMPDEGSFDWLDAFLGKNPSYTELSDRAFADWAEKSGLKPQGKRASNDKPQLKFGVPALDAGLDAIKKSLMQLATLQPRNFVILEVKGNLSKDDRAKALAKFKSPLFTTVADVIVGDPPSSIKKLAQKKALAVRQEASDKEFKVKKIQEKREWEARKKKKEMEKQKAKMEVERKKKLAEIVKKRDAEMAKKKKELEKKKAEAEGKTVEEEEEKEEEKPEEKPEEEEAEEPDEPEPADEEPPTLSLTDEEKKIKFFKGQVADIAPGIFATNFAKFTFPAADEGFDKVKYSWSKEADSAGYLKDWILERKVTTRVEDIVPSAWFKEKNKQWGVALNSYKKAQADYKQMLTMKEAAKRKKAADKEAKAKQAAMKKVALEKKAKMDAEKKAKEIAEKKAKGEEVAEEEEKPEEKPAEEPAEEEEEPEEPEPELNFEGIDVFGVQDVLDVGNKVPLFKEFLFEDFAMLSLRFELHLLAHAFSKDCNDEDRTGIYLDHLPFYYQKYYGKQLHTGSFGVKTVAELVELVNDTVNVTKQLVIESLVPSELESFAVFAKITEESRRNRALRVDMGEESAKLKISQSGGGGGGGWQEKKNDGGGQEKKEQKHDGGWGGGGGNKGGKGWGGGKGGGKGWGKNKW